MKKRLMKLLGITKNRNAAELEIIERLDKVRYLNKNEKDCIANMIKEVLDKHFK